MREEHDSYLKLLLDAASSCNMMLNESKSQLRVRTLDILGYRVSFQQVKPDPQRLQSLLDLPPLRTPKELKRVSGMFSYYAKWIPRFSKTAGPLMRPAKLPLDGEALATFNDLKKLLGNACLTTIQNGAPFEVETDASDYTIAAILEQGGRPVAFMSRTLHSLSVHLRIVLSAKFTETRQEVFDSAEPERKHPSSIWSFRLN